MSENLDTKLSEMSWAEIKDVATLIEAKMAHELNLIGHRMTWLVVPQSFLFTAWATLQRSGLSDDQKWLLFKILGSIGPITAVVAWVATFGAMEVHDKLLHARAEAEKLLCAKIEATCNKDCAGVLLPQLGHSRNEEFLSSVMSGHAPPTVLPPLFIGAWAAIGAHSLASLSPWQAYIAGVAVFAALSLPGFYRRWGLSRARQLTSDNPASQGKNARQSSVLEQS